MHRNMVWTPPPLGVCVAHLTSLTLDCSIADSGLQGLQITNGNHDRWSLTIDSGSLGNDN
jgi:hypothetical protein